ncbi:hypothetical protein O6H91_07G113400 [Diphasiastrum complanatum]|uniref:Uncharacterized protein n=1 Tax=Diphasiastrum complanatum TaxID=34168 RepID=A0ACC2D8X1_DIPCM|nr:hypothetical protein O6H91_07G113400 [Diphasiastrum complanatum]
MRHRTMAELEKLIPQIQDGKNDDNAKLTVVDSKVVKFLGRAFGNVVQVTKRMPTGTLLAFNIFQSASLPTGACGLTQKIYTGSLLGFWGIASFVLAFTDSYRAPDGKVYYGIATWSGLWTAQIKLSAKESAPYKLTARDFAHATLSVVVFFVSSLSSDDVVGCFFPGMPKVVAKSSPALTSLISTLMFIFFPSTRHGIDYPGTFTK